MLCVFCKTNECMLRKNGQYKMFCSTKCQSLSTLEKRAKTNIEKYGTSNPMQSKSVLATRDANNLEKYGVTNPFSLKEIQEKQQSTCEQRYGTKFASQSIEIQEKIKHAWAKYPNGMPWLDPARKYVCEHNIVLPNAGSSFERQVAAFIQQEYTGEILVNNRQLIGKEIDIYLPNKNLAFECNDTYWHSELNGRTRSYHLDKTNKCKEAGVHLVHVWEHDWNLNANLIKSRLASLLGTNKTIYARKCKIVELSTKTTADFLIESHIQGACASSVRLGLQTEDGALVAVMTFGKSRFSKVAEFELIRFCNALGTTVVGGANKLFKHFLKTYNPKGVISYSDKSFNTGKLYETLGFVYSHSSAPAYSYTTDYKTLENRIKFQKHKLEKQLEKYDSNLSEWDNMQLNGYDRIWDCGTDVWVYSTQSSAQV